jgi:hypothetical protein
MKKFALSKQRLFFTSIILLYQIFNYGANAQNNNRGVGNYPGDSIEAI